MSENSERFQVPLIYTKQLGEGVAGLSVRQIAQSLDVSWGAVHEWVAKTFTRHDKRCVAYQDFVPVKKASGSISEEPRWSFVVSLPGVFWLLGTLDRPLAIVQEFREFLEDYLSDEESEEIRKQGEPFTSTSLVSFTPPKAATGPARPEPESIPVVQASSFVAPHFIEELGEEGLTGREVAQSLGVEHDNLVRLIKKLKDSGDITCEAIEIIGKNALGKTTIRKEFLLTTEDAKFVVTQSSTKAGRAYCRYLIKCEAAVHKAQRLAPEIEARLKAVENQNERLLTVVTSNSEVVQTLVAGQTQLVKAMTSIVERLGRFESQTPPPSAPTPATEPPRVEEREPVAAKPVRIKEAKFMTPREVAEHFRGRVTERTLANWRYRLKGPAFHKIGGRVLYEWASVDAWEEKMVHVTRQPVVNNKAPRERAYPSPPTKTKTVRVPVKQGQRGRPPMLAKLMRWASGAAQKKETRKQENI